MNIQSEKKVEILAPVGGEEQLLAAVRCGADAVYLGMQSFNARRNAANFDGDGLKKAVAYCHARNVAVHVTVNTCVRDGELEDLKSTIRDIAAAGADAVIVQDLAVAALFHKLCPSIHMHASTQMAVHNIEGVKQLERLGFTRAVLARELTIEEIRSISAATPLETEVFIHGALCMCTSGCCTMSSMLGGRSGNRGLCAQPCRLNFKAGEREYALSLKDLDGIPRMQELVDAGVASLKIEGRMKRPEYVAAAVTACVAERRGEQPDLETLKAVFSRSGFTDGYLTGKRTLDMFGYRTKDDVVSADPVLKTLKASYRAERQSVPVDMVLELRGDGAGLSVTDGVHRVESRSPDGAAAAECPTGDAFERAKRSLEKTGGTPFYLNSLKLTGPCSENSLPVSVLNGMRREAIDKLLALRETVVPHEFFDEPRAEKLPHRTGGRPSLRLRFARPEQVTDADGAEFIILPVGGITAETVQTLGPRLIAELPRLCWPAGNGDKMYAKLKELRDAGLTHILAENIYGFTVGCELGLTVHGGFGLNVMNTDALREYAALGAADMTLSFELPYQDIASLGGELKRGAVTYGYLPLMYFRSCPMKSKRGCADCTGCGDLIDRKGIRFTVRCEQRQFSVLYNSVPLAATGNLKNIDFETLYFTGESRETCSRIIRAVQQGEGFSGEHTRGLYFRELL